MVPPTYPNRETLARSFGTTQWLVEQQTKGLAHADSLRQLPFRGNCMNWLLGHILHGRNQILTLLGEEVTDAEEIQQRYARGSDPVTQDEETLLQLEQLVERIRQSTERIQHHLTQMDDAELEQMVGEGEGAVPLGERLAGLHWHETYHAGQLEIHRQLVGVDDVIIA